MDLISFKVAVVSRTTDGDVLWALMDGKDERARCVGLLVCHADAASATCEQVSSALKDLKS